MDSDRQRRCQGSFVLYGGSVFALSAPSHFLRKPNTIQIRVFPPSPPPTQPLCLSQFTGWNPSWSSYKHQTVSMAGIRLPQSLRGNLHGQRFTCRYDISRSTSASMAGDKPFLREFSMGSEVSTQAQQPYSSHKNKAHFLSQENPHTPPNLLTPNLLCARRTTGSLQWSDSPLWDIVVHPFFFPFLLTPTDINNSSMGSNGY